MLSRFLASTGLVAVVGSAVDGGDALTKIAELKPDLVLLDLEMPGMNGLEATRRIKQMERAPRIIIVSFAPTSTIRLAMQTGADAYCDKATLTDELPRTIRALFPHLNASSEPSPYDPS
jgi:two-component system response regulator DesR